MLRKLMVGTLFLAALFALGGSFLFSSTPISAQVLDETQGEIAPPEEGEAPLEGERGQRGERGERGERNSVKLTRAEKAEVVAGELGISVEALQEAREADVSLEELAAENGTTVDAIEDALMDAQIAKINEAVANGDITQEQADAMIERIELKALADDIFDGDDAKAAMADALGITVEELEAAKEDGTLRDLVEESGVDVRAAVEAAREAAIDAAVADGTITAEQAEQIREMGNGRGGNGGGRGGNGGRGNGDGRGGNGGQPPAAPTQDA